MAEISGDLEFNLDTLQSPNPVEKIHVHFDRAHYSAGDTMWFKSYLVQRSNQLTENSRVMYIDLINSSGKTIQSTKIPVEAGLGWGHIALDAGLPGGVYRILAYTNWMKNYGEESFFTKTINVSDLTGKRVVVTNRVLNSDNKKSANVTVQNIDGSPLAQTTVKYTITLRDGKLVKGDSRTDSQGKLQIPLNDNSADLDLTLDMETGPVVRNFHLPVNDDVFDAQFFPEGGGLVTGLASRIGVKVTGADGLPREATGYIINQQQSHIASFNTEFGGMGVFGLNPQAGEQYTAVVQTKGNQTQKFTIPAAASSGYVMTISSDSLNFIARIKSSPDKVGSAVTLQVSAGGREIINIREKAVLPQLVIRILKAELPAGVNRVTLMASESLPVAERLIFVDQLKSLSAALGEDRESFPIKNEIKSTLKANDASGKPALGSFSLAITDEDRVMHQEESEVTILSNLLLTSEIKGNIENPNYYFINVDGNKRRELDNLLLTQGWRRFNMIAKAIPAPYEAEKGLRVSGKVLTPLNSPAPSSIVNLIVGDGSHGIFTSKTNEKGGFVFDSLYFEGPNTLRLTASNNRANLT
ncbi:hypothetical protein [Daejeonella lutea]|uniref:hypothetical protein n=1 Tax=Daejeonella lutea TaxID=572036 RepID=UPI0011165EC7|nr:hypothetical protein [Daejeonella lutea]